MGVVIGNDLEVGAAVEQRPGMSDKIKGAGRVGRCNQGRAGFGDMVNPVGRQVRAAFEGEESFDKLCVGGHVQFLPEGFAFAQAKKGFAKEGSACAIHHMDQATYEAQAQGCVRR